jgi:TonB family protein
MRAGSVGGIQAPKVLKRVEPVYPAQAKAERVQGSVVLEIVVDTEGIVTQAEVTESVPLLDKAAVAAVSQWKYTPTLLNNEPIEVILSVTLNFRMN